LQQRSTEDFDQLSRSGDVILSRVHDSWLRPLERPTLSWLVRQIPAAVKPDYLTIIGVIGAFICGTSYWASSLSPTFLWLASTGLIVNWLGDSLDGTLARFRKIERPRYGFFVDNSTDIVSEACIFLGLGASPYMRFDIACLALLSFYIASLFTFIRAITCRVFQISYYGIGPTEIHLGLVWYNIYLLTIGPSSIKTRFGSMSPIDCFAIVVFAAVLTSFLVMIWSEGRRLAKEDGQTP
jgi:archaetidylinositol phosphate synthase